MIIEYNTPNEVAFLQSNLGSYKVMTFDTTSIKILDEKDARSMILIRKYKTITQFIDNMVANLQFLGEEVDPSILLLLGFYRLHKVSHSEFECLHCADAVAKVLI